MRILKRILLILAVTLLTGMGAVAAWQRNTLEALKYAATMDQEKILTEIQENEQTLERVMKEYALHGENLTAEDIQKLQSGQMTEEEAIEKLLTPVGEAQAQTETTETPQAQASSSAKENADVDAAVQRQIARLYALKAQYLGQIEGVVAGVKAQYQALPAEQRTASAKQSLISSGISRIAGLEGQCDGQVAAVVSELRSILSGAGRSTSLADRVQSAYNQEKSLKKAYYASQIG